jgi:hypothetical protein
VVLISSVSCCQHRAIERRVCLVAAATVVTGPGAGRRSGR